MPIVTNYKRQFGAFSAARDVTHQLQEVKWKAGNIINVIQVIKNALKKVIGRHVTCNIILNIPLALRSAKLKNFLLTS